MFDLRLLGSFELAQTEGEAPVRLGAKPQALLAYLAMSAGKSVPRGRLAGLLWGERDEENARHSLSQALSTIRGALGPDGNYLIQAAVDGIRLEEANIDVDAKSFERLANSKEQAKLLQARELYRGELLQGLDISERDFEEWMLGERYRLAEIAATAFSRLLDLQISTKDYEEAVDTARDLIAVTPLEEAAHARLITLYGALNRRGLAESHYNRCRELFRRELDRDPGKEIEDAIKSAREYEPGIDLDPTSNQLFSERRLTTILAADIVGYSRMMAEDEAGTLASIKDLRSRLIDPKVTLYRGRVVKLMGDGALMEFGSVVDAVNFAIDVQTTTIDQNRDMPDEQQISFRIGINVGDIIVDGEDIYGDGVNIAARLEGLAEPGGICVSGTVYDHVHGKVGAGFDDLGEQHVKNIPKPVQAYKIVLDSPSSKPGLRPWIRRASTGPNWTVIAGVIVVLIVFAGFSQWLLLRSPHDMQLSETNSALPIPDKPSIAVLPFDNISGDPNQEYFSDGITNELITDLSRVSGLFVIASNTSFTYDGQAVSVSDVGHDLGVRFVLEGSVQKASERVRISARLIDATTGFQVWADQYDRKLNDVFSLQDEVVAEIISALKVKLSPRERVALARKDTNSLEAYDYFLRGYEILRSSPQDVARIRVMFERAIELDPSFARAYANLALTYTGEVTAALGLSIDKGLARAGELAEKALEIDDTLPSLHLAMALVHQYKGDYEQALASVQKALELDLNFADAYAMRAAIFNYSGRPDKAGDELDNAFRLNPYFPGPYLHVQGMSFFLQHRYDEAIKALEQLIERNPDYQRGRLTLAASYAYAGRLDDAEWQFAEISILDPDISSDRVEAYFPFKDPQHRDLMLNGLKLAGLDA